MEWREYFGRLQGFVNEEVLNNIFSNFVLVNRRNKIEIYSWKYDVAVIGAGHAGCEAALAMLNLALKP